MTDIPARLGAHNVSFGSAVRVWLRVAALSFGGPAGQIAVMHRIVVEEQGWIGETRFLHALGYCNLLPGPEAQQLAIYIGWLMHRTRGGVVAGVLFVLPGAIAILVLSLIYAAYGQVGAVAAIFFGLKAAVLAVVVQAVIRLGKRSLRNTMLRGIAAASFLALFVFGVPFPAVVVGAGAIGWLGARAGIAALQPSGGGHAAGSARTGRFEIAWPAGLPDHTRPNAPRTVRIAALWLAIWLVPLGLVVLAAPNSIFADVGKFFAQTALVAFGGAYAILAYVAQHAVAGYGWLTAPQMLDGLGLAETTPGPLIMVVQFVGFIAAFHAPGSMNPLLAGTLAALLTTWLTFAPCFLWVFLGGPYIEALRGNRSLSAALGAISAAIAGVILNLAAWFALHTLFGELRPIAGLAFEMPVLASVDPWACLLAAGTALAMFRFGVGAITTLAGSAVISLVVYWLR